ncbi:MAG: CHC2 zinc finger domain-containing protein [Dysosmobacter sp.]
MGSYPDEFPFNIMDVVELLHLRIRRQQSNSVYVDCPFCGDRRGKMNVNFVKNVWRCNYCGEHGGMLGLYARLNNTTTSDAYWEIAEALCDNCHEEHIRSGNEAPKLTVSTGSSLSGARADAGCHSTSERKTVPQSEKASPAEIHQTLSLLLAQLTLRPAHREHLRSPKRGLSDEQIKSLGFKSTPPPFLCRSITAHLIKMGCKVEGVPGFYRDDCGYWTMAFYKKTSGILIPAVGFDGRLQGFQIMLDVPLKDKDDPPEKAGAKYIWFSSSSKRDGASSGSPVHLVGDPSARVVYVIEGLLKADISHCLTGRTFAAIAGANNTSPLDPLFALLAQSGTGRSSKPTIWTSTITK